MRIKLAFLPVLIVLLFVGSAWGQESVSPQKKALILQFLELTGGKKAANEIVDVMVRMQESEMTKMLSKMIDDDKSFSPDEKLQMKKAMTESASRTAEKVHQFFTEKFDLGELLEEIAVPLYDKNFSESELQDLVTFYKSSAGQKMISSAPEMMMESMKAVSEKLGPKLDEFMKEFTKSEVARLREEARPTVNKPVRKTN